MIKRRMFQRILRILLRGYTRQNLDDKDVKDVDNFFNSTTSTFYQVDFLKLIQRSQ